MYVKRRDERVLGAPRLIIPIVLTIGIIVLFALVLLMYRGSLAGNAVLALPAQQNAGTPLTGTVTFSPQSVGVIPIDSTVIVDLNGVVHSVPLLNLVDSSFVQQFSTSSSFNPAVSVTVIFNSNTGGTNTQQQQAQNGTNNTGPNSTSVSLSPDEGAIVIIKRFQPGATVLVPAGKHATITAVSVRGQPLPLSYAALTNLGTGTTSPQQVRVTTSYSETLPGFGSTTPDITVSLAPFAFIVPATGTLVATLSYQGESLDSVAQPVVGIVNTASFFSQQQVVTAPPETTGPTSTIFTATGCITYHCDEFSNRCSLPSLNQITTARSLELVQTALCTYECGKKFWITRPCFTTTPTVEIVDDGTIFVPEPTEEPTPTSPITEVPLEDSSPVVTKYQSRSGTGDNLRSVTLFDTYLDVPVAHVILDDAEEDTSLDVVFVQSGAENAPHCYNTVEDEGEEGVDCGGGCTSCKKESVYYLPGALWITVILLGLLLVGILRKKD